MRNIAAGHPARAVNVPRERSPDPCAESWDSTSMHDGRDARAKIEAPLSVCKTAVLSQPLELRLSPLQRCFRLAAN